MKNSTAVADQTLLDSFHELVLKDAEKPQSDRIFLGESCRKRYLKSYDSNDFPGILHALRDNPHPDAVKFSKLLAEKLAGADQKQPPPERDKKKDDSIQRDIFRPGELYEVPIDMVSEMAELQIFSKDGHLEDKIVENMLENGFDKGSPIRVFQDGGILKTPDGNTRLRAARKAGLKAVWVIIEDIGNPNEAMIRAVQAQTLRRNMTPSDLFAAIRILAPIEAEKAVLHQR